MSSLFIACAAGGAGALITYLVMCNGRRKLSEATKYFLSTAHSLSRANNDLQKQLQTQREHFLYQEGWEMGKQEAAALIEALQEENEVLRSQVKMESILEVNLKNHERSTFGNVINLRG